MNNGVTVIKIDNGLDSYQCEIYEIKTRKSQKLVLPFEDAFLLCQDNKGIIVVPEGISDSDLKIFIDLVEEQAQICNTYVETEDDYHGGPLDKANGNYDRSRQIATIINDVHGFHGLQIFSYMARILSTEKGAAYMLNYAYDGIGEWQC